MDSVNKNGGRFYAEINIARGIAVLSVLLGHSFPDAQAGINSPTALWIHTAMYGFHMGCFFLLAGFVSGRKLCDGSIKVSAEILKKLKRLIVPYLFYSFITLGLKQVFAGFAYNQFDITEFWKIFMGKGPNGGMWYLWTLFVISVLYLLIGRLNRKAGFFLVFGAALYVGSLIIPSTFMYSILKYSIYYSLGIVLQQNYEKAKPFMISRQGSMSAVISAVLFVILVSIGNIPYLLTCMLGSYVVLVISCRIAEQKTVNAGGQTKIYKVLNELGNYSYDIYLITYFVQVPVRVLFYKVIPLPYWIVVAMMFVLGALVPYIVCKCIIRKIPILAKVVLGSWK